MQKLVIPERYRKVRLLGEGGMGEVWEVEDTLAAADTPRAQALKVVRADFAFEAEERFRAEFRILASLRHPNLARVFEYGRLGDGRPYYTAELVPGRPLTASAGQLPVADVCQVLAALCRVLDFLALRGLVHNDVKPSNVVIAAAPDGAERGTAPAETFVGLKLLDFGLAVIAADAGRVAAGTPPYMAPERLRGEPADHRSDLFALGVTIYRTLTGAFPFDGGRPGDLLVSMGQGYSPARVLRPDCPEGLDAILGRLLALDPRERPQRAAEVFDLLADAGLGRMPLETPGTRDAYALSGAFVGREDEAGALLAAASHAGEPGAPVLALVRGAAGAGKSRLLGEVRLRLQLDGRAAFAARAGAAGAPFAPIIDIARLALASGEGRAAAGPALLAALGADAVSAPARAIGGAAERARLALLAARALGELAGEKPFVATIDDLDRADEGTLETLAALLRLTADAPSRLLVVGGVCDERVGVGLAGRLDDWTTRRGVLVLGLGPLGRPALRRMLDSLFGAGVFGERAAERILGRSAGSPLVVEELVRALLRRGALRASATGWTLADEPTGRSEPAPAEGALVAVFGDRLRALDPTGALVARALAVLGVPSDITLVAAVAEPDVQASAFEGALGRLDAGGLIVHEGGRVGLFHEAFSEAVIAAAPQHELRVLHLRAAAALAAAGAGGATLAQHYLAAGDAARGFPAALAAGLRARDLGDFGGALALLTGAATLAEAARASTEERARLFEGLGDVRAVQETADAAAREYERGLSLLAPDGRDAARLCAKAAHAFVVRGDYDAAERWIARAGPDRAPLAHPELERARLWLMLYRGQLEAAAARARDRLAEMARDPSRAADAGLRPEAELVLGQAASWFGRLDEARTHLDAALQLARAAGDLVVEMTAELGLGMLETVTGNPRAAVGPLGRAVELCERTGNQRQLELAVTNLGATYAALGDYDRAEEHLRRIIARRRRLGITPEYPMLKLAEVRTLRGDAGEARALLEQVLAGAPDRVPSWIRVEAALFLAVLEWMTGEPSRPGGREPAELAAELAREAGSGAGAFQAMALSAEAFACAGRGENEEALALLARARRLYADYHAALYAAGSQYAAAEILRRTRRLGEARAAFEEVARALDALGNAREAARARDRIREITTQTSPDPTMQAADTLKRCTEASRRIGRLLDRPAVVAALADAAFDVLGARSALVVQRGPEGPVLVASRHARLSPLDEVDVRTAVDAVLASPSAKSGPGWVAASADAEGAPRVALYAEVAGGPGPLVPEVAGLLVETAAWALRGTMLAEKVRAARRAVPEALGTDMRTAAQVAGRYSQMLELTIGVPEVAGRGRFRDIVGRSAPMKDLLSLLDRLSGEDVPVLVLGETGTGKELVARAIHAGSRRAAGPFVAVNCAALPPTLAESDLFGHVRGAFTGAQRDRRGLFEEADGGTLFLDEIGEMDVALQAKLLRVVEDGQVRPLGASARGGVSVDVRIVAATNRDLAGEVTSGRFRRDLFYRLSVLEVHLPPLRDRAGDLPVLVKHFLTMFRAETGSAEAHARVSADAMAALQRYEWPGNVRELENELRRAWLLAGDDPIGVLHLSPRLRGEPSRPRTSSVAQAAATAPRSPADVRPAASGAAPAPSSLPTVGDALRSRVAVAEREAIVEALRKASGKKSRAAILLGLSRPTLNAKIKRYGIPEPTRRRRIGKTP